MSTRFRLLVIVLAAALALSAPSARAQQAETPSQTGSQAAFTFDQTVTPFGDGAISAVLPNLVPGPKSAQAADDFIIAGAANEFARIQTITAVGRNVGSPVVDKIFIRVYGDAGGLPVTAPSFLQEVVPSVPVAWTYVASTNILVPVNRTFWISVQANVLSTSGDVWSWNGSNVNAGTYNKSAWVDTTKSSENTYFNDNALCVLEVTGFWGERYAGCQLGSPSTVNMSFKLQGDTVTLARRTYLPSVLR